MKFVGKLEMGECSLIDFEKQKNQWMDSDGWLRTKR